MKKLIISSLVLAGSALGLQAQSVIDRTDGSLTLIGGWDFNGGNSPTVASVNARYNQQYNPYYTAGFASNPGDADYGTVYFTSAGGVGATFGSNRSLASSNAPSYDLLSTDGLTVSNNSLGDQTVNTRSILLSSTTVLDNARAVFRIDTINSFDLFTGLSVDYSARNQGSSSATISWSYSIDGGSNFIAIGGSSDEIAPSGASYSVFGADFSSVLALEGVQDLLIGLEYSEVDAGASVFIDNVAIYGTAAPIPEPSSFAVIAGLAGLGFAAGRRRSRA